MHSSITTKHDVLAVSRNFIIYGDCIAAGPYGTGRINDTYKAAFNQGGNFIHYIFQRINRCVFKNPVEIEYLPFSGKLITMEIGVRFLTDYLSGGVYFKTHRDGHNLDRCRTQITPAESIEKQMNQMMQLLQSITQKPKK
jgi:hypothetical protein